MSADRRINASGTVGARVRLQCAPLALPGHPAAGVGTHPSLARVRSARRAQGPEDCEGEGCVSSCGRGRCAALSAGGAPFGSGRPGLGSLAGVVDPVVDGAASDHEGEVRVAREWIHLMLLRCVRRGSAILDLVLRVEPGA